MKSNISQTSTNIKKTNPIGNRNCYVCGSKYHLQAECPQGNVNIARYDRSSRSQSSQRRNNTYGKRCPVQNSFKSIRSRCAQVGIHQNDPEAGMYVKALIHSVNTNLLVDTGATLSVLSSRVYETIKSKPVLFHTDQVVSSASGTNLTVLGKTLININMGDTTYTQEVIVTDLSVDGVIGLDFMKKYKCTVDVPNGYFNVQDMCYKVEFVGKKVSKSLGFRSGSGKEKRWIIALLCGLQATKCHHCQRCLSTA